MLPLQAAALQAPQHDTGPAEGQASLVTMLAGQNILLERILAAQVRCCMVQCSAQPALALSDLWLVAGAYARLWSAICLCRRRTPAIWTPRIAGRIK